jgi:hypothetical protein
MVNFVNNRDHIGGFITELQGQGCQHLDDCSTFVFAVGLLSLSINIIFNCSGASCWPPGEWDVRLSWPYWEGRPFNIVRICPEGLKEDALSPNGECWGWGCFPLVRIRPVYNCVCGGWLLLPDTDLDPYCGGLPFAMTWLWLLMFVYCGSSLGLYTGPNRELDPNGCPPDPTEVPLDPTRVPLDPTGVPLDPALWWGPPACNLSSPGNPYSWYYRPKLSDWS